LQRTLRRLYRSGGFLTDFRSYMLLGSYPALAIFVFDLFSPGSRWATKNKSTAVPESLRQRDEDRGRVLLLFKYLLLLIVTAWLVGGFKNLRTSITFHRFGFWTTCLAGILAGLLVLAFRRLVNSSPSVSQSETIDYSLRGAIAIWLAIFGAAALTEESWRAICISSFHYGPIAGNVAAAACFSLAHMAGLPPRIPQGLGIATVEAVVGLIFGATFMATGSVLSPILASALYYTGNYIWLRHRYLSTGGLGTS